AFRVVGFFRLGSLVDAAGQKVSQGVQFVCEVARLAFIGLQACYDDLPHLRQGPTALGDHFFHLLDEVDPALPFVGDHLLGKSRVSLYRWGPRGVFVGRPLFRVVRTGGGGDQSQKSPPVFFGFSDGFCPASRHPRHFRQLPTTRQNRQFRVQNGV